MQEPDPRASAAALETSIKKAGSTIWADLICLAVLVVLAVGIRGWQLRHTEVASRDSISFIRIAWQLEHGSSWRDVMATSPQHPGYPLAIYGMSLAVRNYFPNDQPRAWQISAQLVSALASVLLLLPMFYLGRELFDRRIAFWASLLFQCLPTSGKIMGDALSDTLFLLFACTSLWLATAALRRRTRWAFVITGLAGGLAYLVRPEGALVLGGTGLVLGGMQLSHALRQPWGKMLNQGIALTAAALIVMAPYMLIIHGLTVKNTPNIMINQQRPDADWENRLRPANPAKAEPQANATRPSSVLLAAWLGPSDRTFDKYANNITDLRDLPNYQIPTRERFLWALKAFVLEAGKGFFYVLWLPLLIGLWWRWDRFRVVPGLWVGSLVCLALAGLLFRMAEKMGYLSDRHLLLIILCSMYWVVAGVFFLGDKLALGAVRLWPKLAGRHWMNGRVWSLGLLLLLTAAPLPRTLSRLHAERAGFRALGRWLAEHTLPGDYIEDPYCWGYYYAGRVFFEGCSELPMQHPSCFYVILEASRNRHARLVTLDQAVKDALHKRNAMKIHEQEVRRGSEKAALQVWRVPGPYHWTPIPGLPGQRN